MTNVEDLERMRKFGAYEEQQRIINLLLDLKVVRRCAATDKLVAFDTDGKNVLYLTGLESSN